MYLEHMSRSERSFLFKFNPPIKKHYVVLYTYSTLTSELPLYTKDLPLLYMKLSVSFCQLAYVLRVASCERLSQGRTRFFRKRPEAVKACQLYAYIRERRDRWTVKAMYGLIAVSESGYYRSLEADTQTGAAATASGRNQRHHRRTWRQPKLRCGAYSAGTVTKRGYN
ncbi:hypothetical protein D3C74_172420 [compost metagenome]